MIIYIYHISLSAFFIALNYNLLYLIYSYVILISFTSFLGKVYLNLSALSLILFLKGSSSFSSIPLLKPN